MENSTLDLCSDLSGSRSQLFRHRSRGEMQPVGLFLPPVSWCSRAGYQGAGRLLGTMLIESLVCWSTGVTLGTAEAELCLLQIFGFSKVAEELFL